MTSCFKDNMLHTWRLLQFLKHFNDSVSPLYCCGMELANFYPGLTVMQWSNVGMFRLVRRGRSYPPGLDGNRTHCGSPTSRQVCFEKTALSYKHNQVSSKREDLAGQVTLVPATKFSQKLDLTKKVWFEKQSRKSRGLKWNFIYFNLICHCSLCIFNPCQQILNLLYFGHMMLEIRSPNLSR